MNNRIGSVNANTLTQIATGSGSKIDDYNCYSFDCISGRIDFAQLLDVLHAHSKVEKVVDEILGAFEAQDKDKKGVLSAAEISQVILENISNGTDR